MKSLLAELNMRYFNSANRYPYYRVLNEAINYAQVVASFTMPKHHLLPIPQSVIDESNEVIKQNNGYN